MRIIFSLIRIVAGVLIFVFLVFPIKNQVSDLKLKKTKLNTTESNAKEFAQLGQDVVSRFQSLDPAQVERLKKMVPDSVDNVRFINDINGIAKRSGMNLRKVDYNPEELKTDGAEKLSANSTAGYAPYGSYTLRFVVTGSYSQFLVFIDSLENSLRLLDITDITFNSAGSGENKADIYEFSITTRSYWLKN